MPRTGIVFAAALSVFALPPPAPAAPLSPIPQGSIAVGLTPVATGLAAPDYAVSPPGDPSRLFVVEQNGLLRVIENGTLQTTPALDLQSRVQISPVGNGPLNPGNANDERGFL